MLSKNENDEYKEMPGYQSKIPFVKNIFQSRLKTALKFASITNDSRILDIGCHRGLLLKVIRDHNDLCECHGIDVNPKWLQNKIEKCTLQVADVTNLPFPDGHFDAIFVLDVLEHVEKLDQALNEIKRVLKTNGLAVLSGPTETWFYKFCRILWLRRLHVSQHIYTIYDIEKKFEKNNFQLIAQKRFPEPPLPELFRVSNFKKS